MNFEDDDFCNEDLAEVDALIGYIGSLPRATMFMLSEPRIRQMGFAFAAIKRALRETKCDADVTYGLDDGNPGVGFITVEGVIIDVVDMEWFARAAEFSDNMEVLPLVDGRVRMSYSFYGTTTPIA